MLKMRVQNYVSSLCLLLLSVGCSISSNSGNRQRSSISSTPNQDSAEGLISVTASATIKATHTAVKTAVATSTLNLKTPAPTVDPYHLLQVEAIESPNREWIAQTTFEQEIYEEYHVQFTVSLKNGKKTWTVMDYWGEGIGHTYAQLHQWSNDSQYFYFTGDRVAGGGCNFFPVDSKWQRLNVNTGQVSDFLLPLGRGHAISPDESTIAFASPDTPLHISLYDIHSGHEEKVLLPIDPNLEAAQAGDILWARDGNAVILSVATGDCNSSTLNFYLMRVDIKTMDITELAGKSKDLLRPVRLESTNHLLIRDWNGYTWWINATNGEPTTAP